MSTSLDLDLAAMVGEMEAPPCEHPAHARQSQFHSDAPASHYARCHCSNCGYEGQVTPVCPGFVCAILANVPTRCVNCDTIAPGAERIRIMGQVNQ